MITGRMRRVLEDELGYLKGEVDIMEPQVSLALKGPLLYTVGILCNAEWCIRQLWCSSTILYSITSIAFNHHTDIYPLLTYKQTCISPQIAAVVIERGLARPSSGMPIAWRRQFSQDNPPFFLFKLARGGCRVIASLIGVRTYRKSSSGHAARCMNGWPTCLSASRKAVVAN